MWAVPKTFCHSPLASKYFTDCKNSHEWSELVLPYIAINQHELGHSSGYSSHESINSCPSQLVVRSQHMRTRRAQSHKTVRYTDLTSFETENSQKKCRCTVCGCLPCCLPGAAPDFDQKLLDHWSWEKALTSQGELEIGRNGSDKALTKHLECVFFNVVFMFFQGVETCRRSRCFYFKNIRKGTYYYFDWVCQLGRNNKNLCKLSKDANTRKSWRCNVNKQGLSFSIHNPPIRCSNSKYIIMCYSWFKIPSSIIHMGTVKYNGLYHDSCWYSSKMYIYIYYIRMSIDNRPAWPPSTIQCTICRKYGTC